MSTDIEKKSLEAHVELCAERYKNLDDKLCSLDERMGKIEIMVAEIKTAIAASAPTQSNESNKTLITIGTAIVAALLGGIFTLIVHVK